MNPEPDPVESLFAVVVGKFADERTAYLDQACAGDAALRQRVEALLRAHDAAKAKAFLDALPPSETTDETPAEGPGTRIGPYKLLQQIGEGGMGVVFLAEQLEPLQRKVAIKVIKPGMDSHQVVARFEAERQALALMDHPNIAKVLDAGSTPSASPPCEGGKWGGGRPYFVMELVKGLPITKYCDHERLTPQERLQLFVPVCQAVQHAHQKGIIHRDLKPSNILIALYDGRPVPKVIDFGVAKATGVKLTDRTMFTEVGHAIGTWEYMAPEQAELNNLDIDTRADVYALGATLYELLTGSPPFTKAQLRTAAFEEMLRMIREVEPPRPSTKLSLSAELPSLAAKRNLEPAKLSRMVRGDLDWIVMKCLEKERDRRYETANGFAADILRHLAGEAVQAVPPSALYRLRKSARKNRAILTTAAAFVALLLIAAAVSTWLAVQAKQAEAAAQMQQSAAETAEALTATERDHAQREWLRAEDAARQANASAAQAAQALDRLSAARGVQLADECDLFTGLLWLARPLERGGLTAAEERSYRTRFACYLRHTFGRPVLRDLFFHEGEVYLLRFSADGRRFLTGCGDNVRVWDLQSGDCLATLPIHSGEGTAQFSPDGTRVLVVDGRGLWSWDVRTARLADFSLLNPAALAEIIPGSTPESLWQALALTAAREWFKRDLESPLGTLSPDGRQALLALGPRVQLFDLPTRRLLQSWPKPPGYRQGLFTADGSRILLNADALRIYNAHPESGAKGDVDLSSAGSFESSNADGCRIVTLKSAEGNKEGLMAVRETSSGKLLCPISVSEEMGADHPADLSPDGQVLARHAGDIFHPGRLELWDVDHGRMLAQRPMRQNGISGVYFRSDGRQVATIGDRSVGLWNVPCWSHRRQA